jgi:hypothetical protein
MTFSLQLALHSRDFTTAILPGLRPVPVRLSWAAYGGPREAQINLYGDANRMIDAASWLRAPVTITDHEGIPAWWGFVNKIVIHHEGTRFTISLDELFNRVKVAYSYTSPDHQLADQNETAFADNLLSQQEYGIKEKVLFYTNIDDLFAEVARDTFLSLHAFPKSRLDTRLNTANAYVTLHCKGWFQTFGWKSYANIEGFYANYGPGPGVFPFSTTTVDRIAQSFKPLINCSAKYLYFRINKVGVPPNNPYGQIYTDSGGSPNVLLGNSTAVARGTIPTVGYPWFRFNFSTPISLSANTQYWACIRSAGSNASNYYQIRTDEVNENAAGFKSARYLDTSIPGYVNIPNVTAPGNPVSLYYRVICIEDTGTQIANIAAAGNQFFNNIWTLTTNAKTSPYTQDEDTCLSQLHKLMNLGTSNGRLILASVSPDRNLTFYEQPDPSTPTAFLSKSGHFYTAYGSRLPAWRPPVGQFAILANTPRLTMPFDKNRTPTCFIRDATYYPGKDRLLING